MGRMNEITASGYGGAGEVIEEETRTAQKMAVDVGNGTVRPTSLTKKSEEAVQLMYGADLLLECSRSLKFPASISALACTIFHRFYHTVSPRSVSPVWAAAAALLLAGKHDGVHRRLRDVANVVHSRLVQRECWANEQPLQPLDYYGAAGYVWKQSIIATELKLLRGLGFRVQFEMPHKFILVFVNTLRSRAGAGDWLKPGPHGGEQWRKLLQRAWSAANDVMRVPVCVTARTEDLACACIARGAQEENIELPQRWNEIFGATENAISAVDSALSLLYAAPPLCGAFIDLADAEIVEACQGIETQAQ